MHFNCKYLSVFILMAFFCCHEISAAANDIHRKRRRDNRTATTGDTQKNLNFSFIDSLKNDSLKNKLVSRFSINVNKTVIPKAIDPFDPYAHQAFYRVGQAKFWFFLISLLSLGLFLYYRAAFPKQFYQRYRGVFNNYYFNEYMTELAHRHELHKEMDGTTATMKIILAGGSRPPARRCAPSCIRLPRM
ncbi:MAG: hypothetical protein RIT07_1750, partial [Bacteroidota bacterium]